MIRIREIVIFILFHFLLFSESSKVREIVNPSTGTTSTVQYDEQGVPFITSTNIHDLMFTQGYIVAENRLWEMEIYRRVALGRTAEIFGQELLSTDESFRRLNYTKVAQKNLENTPEEYVILVNFYMEGVNQYLAEASLDPTMMPPEFAEYDAPFPAPFTPIDSLLLVKLLGTGLSGNARAEPGNQQLLSKVGLRRFHEFMARDPNMPYITPPYHHSNYTSQPSLLKSSNYVPHHRHIEENSKIKEEDDQNNNKDGDNNNIDEDHQQLIHDIQKQENITFNDWKMQIPFSGVNIDASEKEYLPNNKLGEFLKIFKPTEFTRASNSWAISGKYTSSGKPLFSNDPHLSYTAPMIWFIIGLHLDAPDSKWNHIVGSTIVLTPGIGIGRNEYLSWGYTMVESDNQDLYIMQNLPGNLQYNYSGTVYDYEISYTLIEVKDQSPVNFTIMWSVYGPVIPDDDTGLYYSLHWTNLYDTDTSVEALIGQNIATTIEEYFTAVSNWWSLCFNAVVTDELGNIGYKTTGATPHRPFGDHGNLPKPGDGSRDWIGLIPNDNLPNIVNPDQGFLVTANNPVAPESELTYPIAGYYDVGFRAQRIIDMIIDAIDNQTLITTNYSSSIQASVVTLEFFYLYPTIQNLVLSDAKVLQWQQDLLNWDGNELKNSKEATIYEEFVNCLANVTYYEIGRSWSDSYFLARVFNDASVSGEGDDISCNYWNQTCVQYASTCFANIVNNYPIRVPQWGDLPHWATFPHLLPVPIEGYNRAISVGGSANTPNAAHSAGGVRGPVLAGPSMRFIADMSGEIPNLMVLPMGESGVPTSPHYDDQLVAWANNELFEVDWSLFSSSSTDE